MDTSSLAPATPSEHPRRGLLPPAVLLASGLWAWWAAYDRGRATPRLLLWLCAVGLFILVRALSPQARRRLPALLALLNSLLAAAIWLALPLPLDSDTLGGILAVFLPFSLLVEPPALRPAALLLPLIALFQTREYGAWIGLLGGAGMWMLAPWAARRLKTASPLEGERRTPLLAGALFLGFLLLLGHPAIFDFLQRLPIPWEDLHTRLEYARNTLYLIADYPLGGGFASFSGLNSRYILGIAYVFIESSHNLYLDLAQEQGLLALGTFLYLLSAAGTSALSRSAASPLARASSASLLILAVHGLFEAPLYTSPALPLLFLPLALAFPRALSRRLPRLALPALILTASALLFLQYPATRQAQIELRGWPETRPEQTDPLLLQPLQPAYRRITRLLPAHFASQYRLGLIALQERDFPAAVEHLQTARLHKPAHPGERKALAYALVWNGDLSAALPLLRTLPEAPRDLRHYSRWWAEQGRDDLSGNARRALELLSP